MRWLVLLLCGPLACANIQVEQRERIAAYKADQSRDFVSHLAEATIDPKKADIVAVITTDALNVPLKRLTQSVFPAGNWQFVPTQPPRLELNTGSALLYITGVIQKKNGTREAEVTIVAGLAARWNDEGSHIYFKPSALAVVPTLGVGLLDFALGSYLRNSAQEQAALYLKQRIGEIDVPVQLMLPVHRQAIRLELPLRAADEAGAVIRYELPEASAEVKLRHLYLWLLEGRMVVLAYADIGEPPEPAPAPPVVAPQPAPAPPAPPVSPKPALAAPAPAVKP